MRLLEIFLSVSVASALKGVKIYKRGACASKNCIQLPWNRCNEKLLVGITLYTKYFIQHLIGYGAQAVVYKASYGGQGFAVKCYKHKSGIYWRLANDEIAVLDRLKQKNIIQKIHCSEELDHLFLVTEYCEMDLQKAITRTITGPSPKNMQNSHVQSAKYPILDANQVFLQILDAVIYMHGNGVFRRDLKPSNILIKSLTAPVVKIADFGLATTETHTDYLFAGTLQYVSPEVLARKKNYPWDKNDVFSPGVILFNLHTGGSSPWGWLGINDKIQENLWAHLEDY